MNVKVGANTHHTPAFAQTRLGQNEIQSQGRVSMPPQRKFKVGGRCGFSRGGVPLQRTGTVKTQLRLPATGQGLGFGRGILAAEAEAGPDASGTSLARTDLDHVRPRKAKLNLGGAAQSLMTRGEDQPEGMGTASYQASLGSRGIEVRHPQGRQVLVEVVNRRPRPAFLRLEGEVHGGIGEFRFATHASAHIEYMRLRCGTRYKKGKRNVLVRGVAPAPGGREVFSETKNRQLRIGRGRHQVWLAAGIIGSAVGVNSPHSGEAGIFHDSQSLSRADLDVCLLGRRGGRC